MLQYFFLLYILIIADSIDTAKKYNHESLYWYYTGNTYGFNDTIKYVKVNLEFPVAANCEGITYPCIYKEAVGALSTREGLYLELKGLKYDSLILDASLTKKNE